eukprot:PLAT9964.1.p1 GENE.PLAT9964.1~~PLAT9964.1.p1  ORF type:complete len:808 (-),score=328.21 PLAT9964.1:33-2324(-)
MDSRYLLHAPRCMGRWQSSTRRSTAVPLLLSCILLLAASACAQASDAALQQQLDSLAQLVQEGKAGEAEESALQSLANEEQLREAAAHVLAAHLHQAGRHQQALHWYTTAMSAESGCNVLLRSNAARLLFQLRGDEQLAAAARLFAAAADCAAASPQQRGDALNMAGLSLYLLHRWQQARELLRESLQATRGQLWQAAFNLGNVEVALRNEDAAAAHFEAVLAVQPLHGATLLNYGAMRHAQGQLQAALQLYGRARQAELTLDERQSVEGNIALVLSQRGDCAAASVQLAAIIASAATEAGALQARARRLRLALFCAEWHVIRQQLPSLLADIDRLQLQRGLVSSLQPFDTLLLPVAPGMRLRIAQSLAASVPRLHVQRHRQQARLGKRLRIAYMSADWGDHPTTHLMAALLSRQARDVHAFQLSLVSYGRNATAAAAVRALLPSRQQFIDVSADSDERAVDRLAQLQLDVLLDLQAHTLHSRAQLAAARPAAVTVSFLVFPGSMGADYIDYLLSDSVVTPPEAAQHYSERLLLLSGATYQPNSFTCPTAVKRRSARVRPLVFVNLCKTDKLEEASWAVWMAILRQLPHAQLWLLAAARPAARPTVDGGLRAYAASHGVHPARLHTLPHVPRAQHLQRMREASLFVDSFGYGAHTTAVDALASGLPVLTLQGGSFRSRVAASLLRVLQLPSLIVHSMKQFEATAVRLGRRPALLSRLREQVEHARCRLFDGGARAALCVRAALQAAGELHAAVGERYHAVLPC